MPRKWSVEDLPAAVASATCLTDVLRELGLGVAGGNAVTVKRWITKLQLDTAHFTNTSQLGGLRKQQARVKVPAEVALQAASNVSNMTVRRRYAELRPPTTCDQCRSPAVWQENPLVLHLDHIDGDRKNNNPVNLRWLCPNCHSQTETYAGKKSFK